MSLDYYQKSGVANPEIMKSGRLKYYLGAGEEKSFTFAPSVMASAFVETSAGSPPSPFKAGLRRINQPRYPAQI